MANLPKCSNPLQFRHKHNNKVCRISPKCLSLCKENFPGPDWHPELKLCSLCRLKVSNLVKAKNKVWKWQQNSKMGKEGDLFRPIIVRVEKLMDVTGVGTYVETSAGGGGGAGKYCSMGDLTDARGKTIRDMLTSYGSSSSSDNGIPLTCKLDSSFSPETTSSSSGLSPNDPNGNVQTDLRETMGSGTPGILKPSGRKSNRGRIRFSDVEAEFLIFSKDDGGEPKPLIMPLPPLYPLKSIEFENPQIVSNESAQMSALDGSLFFEEDLEGIDGNEDEESFMFKLMGLPCLNISTECVSKSDQFQAITSVNESLSEYEKSLEGFLIDDDDDMK